MPYHPLTKDRKDVLGKIMRKGNCILRDLHVQVLEVTGMQHKKYTRAMLRDELVKAMKTGAVTSIRGVYIPSESAAALRAVTNIVDEVLMGYTRMVEKLAYRYAIAHPTTIMAFQDYYDEGIMGLMNAVYYYTNTDVAFMTYVYHCVRRRLANAVNKMNPLSPWTNEARRLHMLYEEARSEFNGPATFEDVVSYLGFDADERDAVQATLIDVFRGSEVGTGADADSSDSGVAFEALAVGDHIRTQHALLDPDQRAAVEAADLTDFERAVLVAFQGGERGWQTQVAKSHINPNTGKPYSRRAPALVLPRIIEKIREIYEGKSQSQLATA